MGNQGTLTPHDGNYDFLKEKFKGSDRKGVLYTLVPALSSTCLSNDSSVTPLLLPLFMVLQVAVCYYK